MWDLWARRLAADGDFLVDKDEGGAVVRAVEEEDEVELEIDREDGAEAGEEKALRR